MGRQLLALIMRRAPPPAVTLPSPERKRAFFYEKRKDQDRAAFELRVPGRKGKPDNVIAYGHMSTCPQNNAPVYSQPDDGVVVDLGRVLGSAVVRGKRVRRPDGSMGGYIPANVSTGVPTARPTLDAERSALTDVVRALKAVDKGGRDVRLALAPTVRVSRSASGRVVTTPDRGRVCVWDEVEDLVWALARRCVR
jgi:hypothetical protein